METLELEGETIELSIDDSSDIRVDSDSSVTVGAIELSQRLAESPQVASCTAKNLTRSALGRVLTTEDACLVDRALGLLQVRDAPAGSLREAVLALLTSPEFSTRHYPTEGQ